MFNQVKAVDAVNGFKFYIEMLRFVSLFNSNKK